MPKKKVSNINPLFGKRLKQYRVACGITQEQIADKLNVNRATYTKYETGVSEPSLDILSRIISVLGIDFNSLLSEKDMREGGIYDNNMPMFNLTKDEQNIVIALRSFSDDEKIILNDKITEILKSRSRNLMSVPRRDT